VKPRVYLETSILSYLTALPSRDLVRAAHQQIMLEGWEQRDRFELFVSEAVLAEARRGDPAAASRRLEAAVGIEILNATQDAENLASALLKAAAMPAKAAIDAAHVALATVHGIDYLLTWNCTHTSPMP
jgi:predicted nucleic acid-binding protein